MIRRWSYINSLNFFSKLVVFKLKKKIKLKLFKKHVKFRKFRKLKLKFFKFRRKAFKNIKHGTNLISLVNTFRHWAVDYKTTRAVIRFEYIFNIFYISFLSVNAIFIKTTAQNDDLAPSFLFNIFTHKLNRAVLPISVIYNSLSNLKFFYIFQNKAAGLAWTEDPLLEEDNKKVFKLINHSDFLLFNVLSDKEIKTNPFSFLNQFCFNFSINFVFFYKLFFIIYTKYLLKK
jgi:hypothetical protein